MTAAERHARVTALFHAAADLPAEARAAALAAEPDPDVRAAAEAMLAHSDTDDLLDRPAFEREDALPDPRVGQRVGPWQLVGRLGQGGMGIVYAAERADATFEQAAALKLVHPGLGSDFRARFVRERALLAGLDHAGIARLLGGGVDADGAPYLAMERVDGVPITDFAEAHGLGVAARLRLFLQACDAVAHAHLHLVVHRDLKPAHILVEEAEGGPRVKLLDFGIARLLSDDGGGVTRTGASGPLTPSYASPEQVSGGPITTATDVYGLGLVLFELLTDERAAHLDGLGAAAAERVITEMPTAVPSAVAAPAAARALRGDVDTIVAKALAKEPARRYATAADLADDVRRHLGGLPVEARPPSVRYRSGRFLRRHRVGVAAAGLVVAALVAGAGVALWQAQKARAGEARAEAVNAFLLGLLNAPNPEVDGRDVRVADLLDRAVASLDSAGAGAPEEEAELRITLGMSYRGLALYDAAEAQLRRALALRTQAYGTDSPEVAGAQLSLGRFYYEAGRYAAADSILTIALATQRRHAGDGSKEATDVLNELGVVQYDAGDFAAAARSWRESLAYDEATKPPGDFDLNTSRANLANALADLGETDEAAALLERAARELRQYHPGDIALYNTLGNLGSLRNDQERFQEAADLQREALDGSRTLFGDRHPKVAFRLSSLGSTLGLLGRDREAEPLLREAVATYRDLFGPDHPQESYPLRALGGTLLRLGQTAEAEADARRAVTISETEFGDDHVRTAQARLVLAEVLLATGRAATAEPLLRQCLPVLDAALPAGHRDRTRARQLLHRARR